MTANTEEEEEGGAGARGTLENGGDDYLDSSEGGAHGAQYLRQQAYVSDEHGEMNLATSSRRSSSNRYPSMGGG